MVEAGALNKKYGFATWFGPTNSYSPPQSEGRYGGTQFTCFTGTKVQILTHKELDRWRRYGCDSNGLASFPQLRVGGVQ